MSEETPAPNPAPTPGDATSADTPPDPADLGAADALAAAQAAVEALRSATGADAADPAPSAAAEPGAFKLPDFSPAAAAELPAGIDMLGDVMLHVKIELGRTRMLVEDVLQLNPGSVVELDKLAGDPVDIFVNDRPVARGEVLVLNDNFCVRINEILSPQSD